MKFKNLPRVYKVGLIGLGLILFSFLYVNWTSYRIKHFDWKTERSADVAIVLGASNFGSKPSPVAQERINHGINLLKEGRVKKLIFAGGKVLNEKRTLAEVARNYAIEKGAAPEDILEQGWSRTTMEDLKYSLVVGKENGFETYLIVSDPLHLKRAMLMAKHLKMEAWPSGTPTTRYRSKEKINKFLRRETCFYIQYSFVTRFFGPPAIEKARLR